VTPVYNDIGRRSIYQNVQLFIWSETGILNVAIFKYSLHKIRQTILQYYAENINWFTHDVQLLHTVSSKLTIRTQSYFWQIKSCIHFDILNAFLRHHIQELYSFRNGPVFWPILYIPVQYSPAVNTFTVHGRMRWTNIITSVATVCCSSRSSKAPGVCLCMFAVKNFTQRLLNVSSLNFYHSSSSYPVPADTSLKEPPPSAWQEFSPNFLTILVSRHPQFCDVS